MKKLLFLSLFVFLFQYGPAQELKPSPFAQKDFQLWLDAGLGYKINKKFDLAFEAAYRRNNNLADLSETYLELQLRSDPLDFLVLSAGYRFSGWFETFIVHRLFAFARFEINAKRFRIHYRIRYDNNFNLSYPALPDYLRNKIKVRYRTRKFPLDPYLAYEFFYRLNHWDRKVTQQRFDLGIQYRISKKHALKGYYRFQQRMNRIAPNKNYILGFSYVYDL